MIKETKLYRYLKNRGTSQRWLWIKINKELQKRRDRLISEQELSMWIREVPGRKMPTIIKSIIAEILGVKRSKLFD